MTKSQALSAIVCLWKEQPDSARSALKFNQFYRILEDKHPHLLNWPSNGDFHEKIILGYLSENNYLK